MTDRYRVFLKIPDRGDVDLGWTDSLEHAKGCIAREVKRRRRMGERVSSKDYRVALEQGSATVDTTTELRRALHRIIAELDAAKPGSNVEAVVWDIARTALQGTAGDVSQIVNGG